MNNIKKMLILIVSVMFISICLADSCIAGTERCGTCDGTGRCNRCEGSGWAFGGDFRCDKCDGTGDCQTCDGTGYIQTGIGGSGVPGFELPLLICSIAFLLYLRRNQKLNR